MSLPKENVPIELGIPGRLSRRQAMQWVLTAAAAAASSLPSCAPGEHAAPAPAPGGAPVPAPAPVEHAAAPLAGYGTDPNLMTLHHAGDFWPLTFTDAQQQTVKALVDVIIPQDEYGPCASMAGVVDMIDEWVSAPYPQQKADRPIILDGLAWLMAESHKRFGKPFRELSIDQQHAICDDICYTHTAKPSFRKAAGFFARFRTLCASAYYSTPAGWKAIGYVGNIPLASFDGPPPEVLEKLGVTQTVM